MPDKNAPTLNTKLFSQTPASAADTTPFCITALYFKSPNRVWADTTLYGARAVKLAPAVEPHSEDYQLLMHESFLKEHFEIMPNMKNFPLLGGAHSMQRH